MIAARKIIMNSFLMQQAIRGTGRFMFAFGAGFSTGMLILAGSVVLQAANVRLENIAQISRSPARPLSPFDAPFGKVEAVASAIKPRAVQVPNRILF